MEVTANTFYYFFSTIAQSFAALVAFLFAAAQLRVQWLDNKVTVSKRALLYLLHPGTPNIDYYMTLNTATDTVSEGQKRASAEILMQSNSLAKSIDDIQNLRKSIGSHVIINMSLVIFSILGIPFVEYIAVSPTLPCRVLLSYSLAAVSAAVFTGFFIYNSLKVSLRRKI